MSTLAVADLPAHPRLVVPASASRDEWLAHRADGLGGSDIAAALGLDPYRSPFEVYLSKVGELEQAEQTEAMRWGQLLEPLVASETATSLGAELVPSPGLLADQRLDWMRVTVDGFLVPPDGDAVLIDFADVKALQQQADARIRTGKDAAVTARDRALLRDLAVRGGTVSEGALVGAAGFIAGKPEANTGETVNCFLRGPGNNDFHFTLAPAPHAAERDGFIG